MFYLIIFQGKEGGSDVILELETPIIQNWNAKSVSTKKVDIPLIIFPIFHTGSVERALTSRYLEVDGFKDCLIDMVKPGGQANVEYCFPLSQPAGCPNNVWQEIGEAYKGKSNLKLIII